MLWEVLLAVLIVRSEEPLYITYSSAIKLLHAQSSYRLHSHDIKWGSGSGQQSVTAVIDTGDSNSLWQVHPGLDAKQNLLTQAAGEPVKCEATIRLLHSNTEKYLHSHGQHSAPVSARQEVTGFGDFSSSDAGDNWVVECTKNAKYWKKGKSVFLRHKQTRHYLSTSLRYKFTERNCRGCPIVNQLEVHAHGAKVKSTKWKSERGLYILQDEEFKEPKSSSEKSEL